MIKSSDLIGGGGGGSVLGEYRPIRSVEDKVVQGNEIWLRTGTIDDAVEDYPDTVPNLYDLRTYPAPEVDQAVVTQQFEIIGRVEVTLVSYDYATDTLWLLDGGDNNRAYQYNLEGTLINSTQPLTTGPNSKIDAFGVIDNSIYIIDESAMYVYDMAGNYESTKPFTLAPVNANTLYLGSFTPIAGTNQVLCRKKVNTSQDSTNQTASYALIDLELGDLSTGSDGNIQTTYQFQYLADYNASYGKPCVTVIGESILAMTVTSLGYSGLGTSYYYYNRAGFQIRYNSGDRTTGYGASTREAGATPWNVGLEAGKHSHVFTRNGNTELYLVTFRDNSVKVFKYNDALFGVGDAVNVQLNCTPATAGTIKGTPYFKRVK